MNSPRKDQHFLTLIPKKGRMKFNKYYINKVLPTMHLMTLCDILNMKALNINPAMNVHCWISIDESPAHVIESQRKCAQHVVAKDKDLGSENQQLRLHLSNNNKLNFLTL